MTDLIQIGKKAKIADEAITNTSAKIITTFLNNKN